MKYHGCILEFTDHRNAELMRAFNKAVEESEYINIAEISEKVVNTPCERFWVSEERAMVVVVAMLKGKQPLKGMRPTKRAMFQEIYNRVMAMRKKDTKAPLADLVSRAVHSPAPKFYMGARCAMEIIYKIKKGFYNRQYRRY